MDFFTRDAELHFGSNAGDSIYNAMRRAKESILVMSPYVSAGYVEFLAERVAKGVAVTVFTNEDAASNINDIYRKIVTQHKSISNRQIKIRARGIWIFALISVLSFYAYLFHSGAKIPTFLDFLYAFYRRSSCKFSFFKDSNLLLRIFRAF